MNRRWYPAAISALLVGCGGIVGSDSSGTGTAGGAGGSATGGVSTGTTSGSSASARATGTSTGTSTSIDAGSPISTTGRTTTAYGVTSTVAFYGVLGTVSYSGTITISDAGVTDEDASADAGADIDSGSSN